MSEDNEVTETDETPETEQQQGLSFDGWLSTQDITVRTLINNHISGLRKALTSERKERKKLEKQVRDVPDGLVLSDDDAKLWQAYKELGTPDELSSTTQQYKALQRDALIRQAAESHQYKPSVLSQLAGDLPLEIKEVEADGKKTQAAYVKVDDKEVPLSEYAQSNWADFMPALQSQPAQGAGTSFVRQEAGTKQGKVNPVDAYLNKKYKKVESK